MVIEYCRPSWPGKHSPTPWKAQKKQKRFLTPLFSTSLMPLLTGEGTFASRPLFWEHEGNAAIRVGDRKLVRLGMNGKWELFDMKADRTEQNNLAADSTEEVDTLSRQWRQWARSANVLPKPMPKQKK